MRQSEAVLTHDASAVLGAITAPRTVTLDGDRSVGRINFDNANKYTIAPGSGGALTIGSPNTAGQINLNAAN